MFPPLRISLVAVHWKQLCQSAVQPCIYYNYRSLINFVPSWKETREMHHRAGKNSIDSLLSLQYSYQLTDAMRPNAKNKTTAK